MLDPREIEKVEINNNTTLKFSPNAIDFPEYYDLNDPKEFRKYIANIKSLVRGSIEYRDYVDYVKSKIFNNCSGLDNMFYRDESKVKTELHHIPFTLEDIITLVYCKNIDLGLSTDVIDMAEEIMELHYDAKVGVYNLNQTEHQMIHNNCLFIPINYIFGDVIGFVEMFKKYMDDYQRELVDEYLKLSKEVIDSNKVYNYQYFDINVMKFDTPDVTPRLKSLVSKLIKDNYK